MSTTTLSLRIDDTTKVRLGALAKCVRRSKSSVAAEAISAYINLEEWRLREIDAGLKDLDQGRTVSHERVAARLRSWSKSRRSRK